MPKTPTPTADKADGTTRKLAGITLKANGTERAATVAPPKLRRRPFAIAIGVLIVVLGSLITAFIVASAQDTVQVVAVRTDINRGDLINATDLMTISLRPDPALRTVPADQLASLIGKRAATDLHAGGLIAPTSVTEQVIPPAGQAVVGIPLDIGQLPGWTLKNGDKVRIISTPRAQDDPSTKAPKLSIEVTVLAVHAPLDQSTVTVVDVLAPSDQAEQLGALAATRRIALVLDND